MQSCQKVWQNNRKPWIPDDICIIGDLNRLRVGPLQTDAVALEDIAKTGRLIEAMLSGSGIIARLKLALINGENPEMGNPLEIHYNECQQRLNERDAEKAYVIVRTTHII